MAEVGSVGNGVDLAVELPVDNRRLALICGPLDTHLRQIEKQLGAEIRRRGATFTISGAAAACAATRQMLTRLIAECARDDDLDADRVALLLQVPLDGTQADPASEQRESGSANGPAIVHVPDDGRVRNHENTARREQAQPGQGDGAALSAVVTRRGMVRARGASQEAYLHNLQHHDLNLAVGPAGTGKTYLAVAMAVQSLLRKQCQRIVLVRPAVEAGEKLGFLPGDLNQKVDPYLRPMYDALYEMLSVERVGRLLEQGVIEVAPLAFMRGRTLNEAFIILDEAQNTTAEQMKMFLTRIGFASRVVITGDITQIDLPAGRLSGLRQALGVLRGVAGVAVNEFTSVDVVRHPLVQRIVEAYEAYEAVQGQRSPTHD